MAKKTKEKKPRKPRGPRTIGVAEVEEVDIVRDGPDGEPITVKAQRLTVVARIPSVRGWRKWVLENGAKGQDYLPVEILAPKPIHSETVEQVRLVEGAGE
jgi:hypothetical protein